MHQIRFLLGDPDIATDYQRKRVESIFAEENLCQYGLFQRHLMLMKNLSLSSNTIAQLFPLPVAAAIAEERDFRTVTFPVERLGGVTPGAKRQRQFSAGRNAARRALNELGAPAEALPRNPDGTVVWPAGSVGSITHCDLLCCSVVARRSVADGIGLDAEVRRPIHDRLADTILTPRERDFRRSLPADLAELWPVLAFSAKEAFYKCYYPIVGTALEFHDIAIESELSAKSAAIAFDVVFLRPDLPFADRSPSFSGRFRIAETLVLTGVALPALP